MGNAGVFGFEQIDEGLDVVAADHLTEDRDGSLGGDEGAGGGSLGDRAQEGGFDVGGFVDTGGDAIAQEVQQKFFFARWGGFQKLTQGGGLLGGQRQRRNAQLAAVFNLLAILCKHGGFDFSLGTAIDYATLLNSLGSQGAVGSGRSS